MRGKLFVAGILAVCFLASVQPSSAASVNGTVAITATVVPSMTITFSTDASGITLGGSGTAAATIAFGNVQAFG